MAEKQTDSGFENAGPEGTNGAASGKIGQAKDDALTTRTGDFSPEIGQTSLEPDYELFGAGFVDGMDGGEDAFDPDELALLSGDLEGYLLDEFGWPEERQRPLLTGDKDEAAGSDPTARHQQDPLISSLVAQATAARHAFQAAVLMGATVPLLAKKHAADDALLRPVLPALTTHVAHITRRLHRHARARQTLTRLPQIVDSTIAFLLRYVVTRPRLTSALATRVLNRQLAGQLPMTARRRQQHSRRSDRRKFRRDGRFYPESNDTWSDMDMWHDEDSF